MGTLLGVHPSLSLEIYIEYIIVTILIVLPNVEYPRVPQPVLCDSEM